VELVESLGASASGCKDECVNPTGIKALAIKDRPVFFQEVQYRVSRLVDATRVSEGMLFLLHYNSCTAGQQSTHGHARSEENGHIQSEALRGSTRGCLSVEAVATFICRGSCHSSFLPCLRGSDQAGGT